LFTVLTYLAPRFYRSRTTGCCARRTCPWVTRVGFPHLPGYTRFYHPHRIPLPHYHTPAVYFTHIYPLRFATHFTPPPDTVGCGCCCTTPLRTGSRSACATGPLRFPFTHAHTPSPPRAIFTHARTTLPVQQPTRYLVTYLRVALARIHAGFRRYLPLRYATSGYPLVTVYSRCYVQFRLIDCGWFLPAYAPRCTTPYALPYLTCGTFCTHRAHLVLHRTTPALLCRYTHAHARGSVWFAALGRLFVALYIAPGFWFLPLPLHSFSRSATLAAPAHMMPTHTRTRAATVPRLPHAVPTHRTLRTADFGCMGSIRAHSSRWFVWFALPMVFLQFSSGSS